MPSALILGGTGQIGMAISNRLTALGWSVTVTSRNPPPEKLPVSHSIVDAGDISSLKDALSKPTELLVSCVAYDEDDASKLLECAKNVGRIVAISSASVYQDHKGRTLDEARDYGFPEFDGSMDENTETVTPGPQTYSTRKMAMETRLSEQAQVPVNLLRPCAIHGPLSSHAREWWFVKRILDGRSKIPIAYEGKSQFQTTSVAAIAESVVLAADGGLPGIANVRDADSPSVREIGEAIMQIMGADTELVGLQNKDYPPMAGATPWTIPHNFTLTSVAPGKLSYAESVRPTIDWLVREVNDGNWQTKLPQLAGYPYNHFDYAVDDAALESMGSE